MSAKQLTFRQMIVSAWLVLAAAASAVAVPLIWLWVAAAIQQSAGIMRMTTQTALAIFPGIIISYAVVGMLFSRAVERHHAARGYPARDRPWPVRRSAWNRSMRDTPHHPGSGKLSLVELTFVLCAIAALLAFNYIFFFAPQPLTPTP